MLPGPQDAAPDEERLDVLDYGVAHQEEDGHERHGRGDHPAVGVVSSTQTCGPR